MPKHIIVCHEKHGDYYWDAITDEAWAASSLAILTERFKQSYWYSDPDDDGLGASEWAKNQRAERDRALALTPEQVEALPDDARVIVRRLRNEDKREQIRKQRYRDWYDRAKTVVGSQDLSTVTVGRNRFAHEEPLAWTLLDERSDYEYERVTLETLDSGLPEEEEKDGKPFWDKAPPEVRAAIVGLAPKTLEWLKEQWEQ